MASTKTGTEFFSDLDLLTNNKMSRASNPVKLRLLRRVIQNRIIDLRNFSRDVYDKKTSITATGFEAILPTDMDFSDNDNFVLYSDSNYLQVFSISNYEVFANKIKFLTETNATLYIEYIKEPSVYTDISQPILETSSVRSLELMESESEYLWDISIRQGQTSGAAQSARFRTNELS